MVEEKFMENHRSSVMWEIKGASRVHVDTISL